MTETQAALLLYRDNITKKELETFLDYDPVTGILVWKVPHGRWGRYPAGSVAGVKFQGYLTIRINGVIYLAHRLAWLLMTGVFPKTGLDHKDHNGRNNRWNNLRAVEQQDNSKNCSPSKNNTSGYMGVNWHKASGRWRAEIMVNRKAISGGYHDNIEDAVTARKALEIEHNFHPNHGRTP